VTVCGEGGPLPPTDHYLVHETVGQAPALRRSLDLPPDPIGYVKSRSDREAELARHFELVKSIVLKRPSLAVHLCESRAEQPG
jgi:hypothetical protein